jgi:hypothetical protein
MTKFEERKLVSFIKQLLRDEQKLRLAYIKALGTIALLEIKLRSKK